MDKEKKYTFFGGFLFCLSFLSRYTIVTLFGIFLTILTFLSSVSTTYFAVDYVERALYRPDNPVFLIILALVLIVFIYLFDLYYGIARIDTKLIFRVLMAYTFMVGVMWIFMARKVPSADPGFVSNAANQFCSGNLSQLRVGGYLFFYPYQLGMAFILEVIYRIFGVNSFIVFQFLNVIGVCVIFMCLHKITKILFDDIKIQNIVLLSMFGCIPPIMYCVWVYGNIWGLATSLIAVWMQMKYSLTRQIIYFVISVICISGSILIRSNGMIVLTAMAIMYLIYFFKDKKVVDIILPVIMILVAVTFKFPLNMVYEYRGGLEINQGVPKVSWIAMGLQDSTKGPGWYNGYSYQPYINNKFNNDVTANQAVRSIVESLSNFNKNPRYTVRFFYYKFVSQWNDPTYQAFCVSETANNPYSHIARSIFYGKAHEMLVNFMNSYQFIIFTFALLFWITKFKKIDDNTLFLGLIILGGFIFHMIWEAKGQYVLPYFIMMIPYAASGIASIIDIEHLIFKTKSKMC